MAKRTKQVVVSEKVAPVNDQVAVDVLIQDAVAEAKLAQSEEVIIATEPAVSKLSEALSAKVDPDNYFNRHTITIVIDGRTKPVVTMDGFWDGMLLKAAMHAIERRYDEVRKISAINAMRVVQDKAKQEQINREAIQ